jgi:hypothetical protein
VVPAMLEMSGTKNGPFPIHSLQKMILHHQVIIMQIETDMTCQQWEAKL